MKNIVLYSLVLSLASCQAPSELRTNDQLIIRHHTPNQSSQAPELDKKVLVRIQKNIKNLKKKNKAVEDEIKKEEKK